jgi:membrane protease subunit HflK
MKSAGMGALLIAGIALLVWAASGFFIVQEGEQAVVTTFGRYSKTVEAGFQWRAPYPFQNHETLAVSQLRSVEVGRFEVQPATGLRDSSMLTQDENIVDIRFTVQFRLKDAKDFLFENRDPELAVRQAAESAVREIVGRSTMNSVLYEQRDAIATQLATNLQSQLDRLKAGVLISSVNVGSVQPPEQVQAAFEDAVKAGQDRERAKNEGEAYANQVIPAAKGRVARLAQEAEAYKAAVIARAEGDAQRFRAVYAEYQKAPGVTRDRMYIDTMQEIYRNVSKVMVSSRSGSNLLYLPLDKLMQPGAQPGAGQPVQPAAEPAAVTSAPIQIESRGRDAQRSRERESR